MPLRWAVSDVARRKGVQDEGQLARLAELDRQTIAGVWGGRHVTGRSEQSRMVALETIRKLCVALDARPPGCFQWHDDPPLDWIREHQDGPPYLGWRVQALAEARGLDKITFARRAHLFYTRREGSKPNMAERVWAGEHRAINLETLDRICGVLQVDLGDLLVRP